MITKEFGCSFLEPYASSGVARASQDVALAVLGLGFVLYPAGAGQLQKCT
jgi:hypothetical protein